MPLPDRALRRLIVDLAAMREEDRAAVLASLSSSQRQAVESLLSEFSDFGFVSEEPRKETVEFDAERFSPWLAARLGSGCENALTPHAREMLRETARALYPRARQIPAKVSGSFGRWKRLPAGRGA